MFRLVNLNDREIRPLLWAFLKPLYPQGSWIEEFNFGKSRADFVVIDNGLLYAFEIKGSKDTLERLPKQIKSYDNVATKNYVVVTGKWEEIIRDQIPEYWGILLAGEDSVVEVRPAAANPKRKSRDIAMEMWSGEIRAFIKTANLVSQPSRISKIKAASLCKGIPPERVTAALVESICMREGYRIAKFSVYTEYVRHKSDYKKTRKRKSRRKKLKIL